MTSPNIVLRHKRSDKEVSIPTSIVLTDDELPYVNNMFPHSKYEPATNTLDELSLQALKEMKITEYKVVFFEAFEPIPNGVLVITPQTTWDHICQELVKNIRTMGFDNPNDITGVALGYMPQYVYCQSKIIDTRPNAPKPYDVFPHWATVHVTMFRRSVGWRPLAVGIQMCVTCGESRRSLKSCSGCHRVYYCSKNCQKCDWNHHKQICKKK